MSFGKKMYYQAFNYLIVRSCVVMIFSLAFRSTLTTLIHFPSIGNHICPRNLCARVKSECGEIKQKLSVKCLWDRGELIASTIGRR